MFRQCCNVTIKHVYKSTLVVSIWIFKGRYQNSWTLVYTGHWALTSSNRQSIKKWFHITLQQNGYHIQQLFREDVWQYPIKDSNVGTGCRRENNNPLQGTYFYIILQDVVRFSSQQLKLGENINTIPTIGFNVEEIVFENLTMTVWDVGGQEKIRALWRHYYGEWRNRGSWFHLFRD